MELINEEMAAFISLSQNVLYQSLLRYLKMGQKANSFFQSEWIHWIVNVSKNSR